MPFVYDSGPVENRVQYKIFSLQYPGKPGEETRPVDAWVFETRDLKDPDIGTHELIWGLCHGTFRGASKAHFWITRVSNEKSADLVIGNTQDRTKIGWVKSHSLRGELLPGVRSSISDASYRTPSYKTKRFHGRIALQGLQNPLTYIEVGEGKVRYVSNGSENFSLDLRTINVSYKPKGVSQLLGYGGLILNQDGRSYEALNINNGREAKSYIEHCQRQVELN